MSAPKDNPGVAGNSTAIPNTKWTKILADGEAARLDAIQRSGAIDVDADEKIKAHLKSIKSVAQNLTRDQGHGLYTLAFSAMYQDMRESSPGGEAVFQLPEVQVAYLEAAKDTRAAELVSVLRIIGTQSQVDAGQLDMFMERVGELNAEERDADATRWTVHRNGRVRDLFAIVKTETGAGAPSSAPKKIDSGADDTSRASESSSELSDDEEYNADKPEHQITHPGDAMEIDSGNDAPNAAASKKSRKSKKAKRNRRQSYDEPDTSDNDENANTPAPPKPGVGRPSLETRVRETMTFPGREYAWQHGVMDEVENAIAGYEFYDSSSKTYITLDRNHAIAFRNMFQADVFGIRGFGQMHAVVSSLGSQTESALRQNIKLTAEQEYQFWDAKGVPDMKHLNHCAAFTGMLDADVQVKSTYEQAKYNVLAASMWMTARSIEGKWFTAEGVASMTAEDSKAREAFLDVMSDDLKVPKQQLSAHQLDFFLGMRWSMDANAFRHQLKFGEFLGRLKTLCPMAMITLSESRRRALYKTFGNSAPKVIAAFDRIKNIAGLQEMAGHTAETSGLFWAAFVQQPIVLPFKSISCYDSTLGYKKVQSWAHVEAICGQHRAKKGAEDVAE